MRSTFAKVLSTTSLVVLFAILLLLIFLDRNINYYLHNSNVPAFNNFTLACAAILLFSFAIIACRHIAYNKSLHFLKKMSELRFLMVCAGLCILTLIVQCAIAYNIGFKTGWDPGEITTIALFDPPLEGQLSDWQYEYLSRYPNNRFLLAMLIGIRSLAQFFGLGSAYSAWVLSSCVAVSMSCFFLTRIIYQLSKNRSTALAGFLLSIALVGLSPWFLVPYTDSFGLFFTSFALWVYVCLNKNTYIKWILFSLICLLGYQIKPTVIIVFLAAIFIEILSLSKSRQQLKKSLAKALCIILGFAIATITSNVLIEKLGVNYNEERSFSMAHYAMMGLNCETNGCVSGEDGEFSAGKQTYQDRIEANIDVISERLDNYGILGLAKHLTKKMLCTYNDGTFGWAGEGGFFKDVVDRTSPFADLLRNIYYPSGEHYRLFCTSQQFFWIFTLMGIILNFPQILFCKESRKIASKKDSDLLVILLSIIGITLFILIFEGRARYLYLYSGFFVIASTVGFSSFANAIAFKKHNPSAQSNNSSTRVSKIQKQKTTSSF